MRSIFVVLVLCTLSVTGCGAIILGEMLSSSSENSARENRNAEFLTWLRTTNEQRQRAGIPMLDVCSECYWYDATWAKTTPDHNCLNRIKMFQVGDSVALFRQGVPPSGPVPVYSDSTVRAYWKAKGKLWRERNRGDLDWQR